MRSRRDFFSGVPVDINKMYSVKLDNLSSKTRVHDLELLFSPFGKIGDIYMPRDSMNGRPCGFAFVRYYNVKEGDRAIKEMDGKRVDSKVISVSWAKNERLVKRDDRSYVGRKRSDKRRSYTPRSESVSSRSRSRSPK
ncbi:putative splicing factor, arginine/serine-rich 4 [Thelohanellus kitauei]|uniref:Serine/arginine-rich splicing factor 2 n=1 Tax=Thelohanellus kitauei TaxID=669202 RepID=A0A0C2MKD2_THEKT|nr:putative splicing factor, arginine/serine-rich 4 [Thelohanellus kitauei]